MQRYERYSETIQSQSGKRRYATMYYPIPERKTTDIYIISKRNDRLDLLAQKYYGDPRMWVVIAKANVLHNCTMRVPTGVRLRIPWPYSIEDIDVDFNDKQF